MQTIYLDISNKGVVPTVYAKQNDVGRKFAVILTDSGLPYIPANGSAFSVWYKGASGEGNYTDIGDRSAFSLNGNKVEVEMIVQMLSTHGDGILCLTLNSPDGNQISSWNIPYICEFVPGSESEKAEEYYTAFSKAVEKLPYPDETLSIPGKSADAAEVGKSLTKKADISYTKKIGNPHNLLDNSDFRNPVNQRGQTSLVANDSVYQYFIDRWCFVDWSKNDDGTLTLTDNGISVTKEKAHFYQRHPLKTIDTAKTHTFAIYFADGTIEISKANSGLHTLLTETAFITARIVVEAGKTVSKVALYEGEYTAETLPEYQPKGYGAELAECLRYYRKFNQGRVVTGFICNDNIACFTLPLNPPMRISPTLSVVSGRLLTAAGYKEATFGTAITLNKECIAFDMHADAITPGQGCLFEGVIEINADL